MVALPIALILLLVFVLPLSVPGGISVSSATLYSNAVVPLTANPSFEQGTNSWLLQKGSTPSITITSGNALSGSHAVFISAAAGDNVTSLKYNNGSTLPVNLNTSMVFSLGMKYEGKVNATQPSFLDAVLTVSYQNLYNITVIVVFANSSVYGNQTGIVPTVDGTSLVKQISPGGGWQTYVLQLATQRMITIYQKFLAFKYGYTTTDSNPSHYLLESFYIHPSNTICYLDDVGIYNMMPARLVLTVSKLTPLPSDMMIRAISVNGSSAAYSYSYGTSTDTYTVWLNMPVVVGSSYDIRAATMTGSSLGYDLVVQKGPASI